MTLEKKIQLLESTIDVYKDLTNIQYNIMTKKYIINKELSNDINSIKNKLSFLERYYKTYHAEQK